MKIFYSDNHFFGVDPIEDELEFGEHVYYLGDNVDVKNAHKSKVFEAQEFVAELEKKAGNHYISGNHELNHHNMEHVILESGIYLTHGDIFSYGEEGANEWRRKKAGKGKFWRWVRGLQKNYKRKKGVGNYVGSKDFKEACLKKATEFGCLTVIIGHKHPKRLQKQMYKGITIYVLPRGKTIIEEI